MLAMPPNTNVENHGGDERVQNDPRGAQDRLLVQHSKVALDEHHN